MRNTCPTSAHVLHALRSWLCTAWMSSSSCKSKWPRYRNTLTLSNTSPYTMNCWRKASADPLVIWGNKVTGDISTPLRFHASKELLRRYLQTRTRDKWTNKRFEEVDWEHLDIVLKNKADMYKIWQSKQMSGFCGTRVKVGMYSGEMTPDERCPNCGRRKTAAHLMLCPEEDRTRLLIDSVDELCRWMEADKKTDPELAYWVLTIS